MINEHKKSEKLQNSEFTLNHRGTVQSVLGLNGRWDVCHFKTLTMNEVKNTDNRRPIGNGYHRMY